MNYEQKYFKYKAKYLNLLSNQKGGLVLDCIPLVKGDIITYDNKDYTFQGEEKFIVNAKGKMPRRETIRIILDNPTTTIRLEFETNKQFLKRKS